MSNYVQLGDVHTYYEEDGEGEAFVLLPPGLADSRAFAARRPERVRCGSSGSSSLDGAQ